MRTHNTAPIIALSLVALLLLASFFGALLRPANFYGADHPIGVASLSTASPTLGRLAALARATITPDKRLQANYGNLPLSFEMNQGQVAHPVKFMARGNGYGLFLTPTEAVLSLRRHAPAKDNRHSRATSARTAVLRMQLVQANAQAKVEGTGKLPGISNYLIGRDPKQWRTNVSHYARVRYKDVYPGVDLVYYGNQRQLEYDFVVAPGADPAAIKLAYQGAQQVHINPQGDLILETGSGAVVHHAPVVYQKINGQRHNIQGRYTLRTPHSAIRTLEVGFRLASYDKTQPIIIDPVLSYSTYLGGSGADQANGIAVDAAGNAYISGQTASTNFPTANTTQGSSGGTDAFVTKLSSTGALVYSTYLGGSNNDIGNAIAVDSSGNAYITGQTSSIDFPVTPSLTAYQVAPGGGTDAFVAKLNATGSSLVYSTYLGGLSNDVGNGIAVDSSGNAYVVGTTSSANFPSLLSLQLALSGGSDAFVAKVNPSGSSLVYSTYLGGTSNDDGNAIAVDSAGNAYVTGDTASSNFPTANAVQPVKSGGSDAFVSKLNASGSTFVYSTYLGGGAADIGHAITVDAAGNSYVAGETASTDFPVARAFQTTKSGGNDAFVSVLNSSGSTLTFSTFLGGGGSDTAYGIAVDNAGNIHVAGQTGSTDFPLLAAFQTTKSGGNDGFVSTLNASTSTLVDSSFLGGSGSNDSVNGVSLDSGGNVYAAGQTDSNDFPVQNAVQATRPGNTDAFVTKVTSSVPSISVSVNPTTFSEAAGTNAATGTITLSNAPASPVVIALSSTDTSQAQVPGTVTVAAGATSATFPVRAVDNNLATGNTIVGIGAAATGYTSGVANVTVTDADAPTLTLSVTPSSFSESAGTGAATGTVSRNTATTSALTVNLSSSNTSQASVPATVTIPAGATSATFSIDAVNNNIVTGNNTVTLTASATGFIAGTATVTVTEANTPTLSLTLAPTTFSETAGAGASTARLTRNTSTTAALTVNLSSSDTTQATVPATVTIPAGSSSVTFPVNAVDDNLVKGNSTVTLTATASGFNSDTANITVTEADTPTLTLSVAPTTFSEGAGAGAATATLSRNTLTTSALTVTLSSSDPSGATVPTTVVIPIGARTVTFGVDAVDDNLVNGNKSVTLTASATSFRSDTATVTVTNSDVPTITMSVSPAAFDENAGPGAATVTVTRNTSPTSALPINLTSSDTSQATVPGNVSIPSGAMSADFPIKAIDNNLVTGPTVVTIKGTAAGFVGDTVTVTVNNTDTPQLTLKVTPATVSEGDGSNAAKGTISRNTSTAVALNVTLSSTNPNSTQLPTSVTIPVGAASATFAIGVVDDNIAQGDRTVTLKASATGLAADSSTLTITDNDVATLSLSISPATFSEGAGAAASTGTVTRNTPTTAAQVVNLTNSNTNKVTVPATVTIPAGATSANFPVAAVDNTVADGPATVTINAQASGFVTATGTVTVTDNDGPTLTVTISPGTFNENAGAGAATGTVSRNTSTASALTVNLASNNTGKVQVPATVTIPVGATSATFSLDAVDDNIATGAQKVEITATATGFNAGAQAVTVNDNDVPTLTLTLAPTSFSEKAGANAARATLSSNTPPGDALVVRLVSSNPNQVSVPTSVTIPAGATSTTFAVGAVSDNLITGPQAVTVTASATASATSGPITSGRAVVTVLEADQVAPTPTPRPTPTPAGPTPTPTPKPTLILKVTPAKFDKAAGAGAATATVTRNVLTKSALTVQLTSNDPTRVHVPATIIIPANVTSVTFPVDALNNGKADGSHVVTLTATATGFSSAKATVTVTDNQTPALTLKVQPQSFAETAGVGAATGTVSRNTPTTTSLQVTLVSGDPSKVRVPATVTIPVGATSVHFPVTAVDNQQADGSHLVRLVASASNFASGVAVVTVSDNQVPALSLSITPSTFSEGAGTHAATGTVSRNTATTTALRVNLLSSDLSKVQVPTFVVIPVGATSATFTLAAINNNLADGSRPVKITAQASGFNAASQTLIVTDNDRPTLTLTVTPAVFSEGAGSSAATGTLTRNTPATTPLTVTLTSSNPSRVRVPTTVTIPAGKTSATFALSAVDNHVIDGAQRVTITARQAGFVSGTASVLVQDNDRPTPTPTPVPTPSPIPPSPLQGWGFNGFGQIGDGTKVNRVLPEQVRQGVGIVTISAGGSHTLAIRKDGAALAWGFNGYGELGDGSTTNRLTPTVITGLTNARAVDAGWYHSLALKSDGTVWAWGFNGHGQLGDGTTTDRHRPAPVQGLTRVTAIAAGVYHNLALKSDGTVWAWGANESGQLGDNTTNQRSLPVQVQGLNNVTAIAAGSAHSLALRSDGTVWAWGSNQFGQLGTGSNDNSATPLPVGGLAGVTAITAGYVHSVALAAGGTRVWAWGSNQYGQVGDGSNTDRNQPVVVRGLTNVQSIVAGTGHTLALLKDGTVRSWGWNLFGQLGDGTRRDRNVPVPIPNLTGVTLIAAGYAHSLALRPASNTVAASLSSVVSRTVARSATNIIQLLFMVPLDAESASDGDHYSVTVNGHTVAVASAGYNTVNHTVTLSLAEGTLRPGDSVSIAWREVSDSKGSLSAGEVGPITAQ